MTAAKGFRLLQTYESMQKCVQVQVQDFVRKADKKLGSVFKAKKEWESIKKLIKNAIFKNLIIGNITILYSAFDNISYLILIGFMVFLLNYASAMGGEWA
jgi:hypothetical protein